MFGASQFFVTNRQLFLILLQFGTQDVRIDTKLNKFIWSRGIRFLPSRVRVRITRQRNEDEDAKEKMYSVVQHVPVESFKGLQTELVLTK